MHSFFTPKNLVTVGGLILAYVLPQIFLGDEYEEYVIPETTPEDEPTEAIIEETTVVSTEEEQ